MMICYDILLWYIMVCITNKHSNFINIKNFTPELPADFVVEYYINMTNIVVAVFNVAVSQQPKLSSKIIGKVKTIKSGYVFNKNIKIN